MSFAAAHELVTNAPDDEEYGLVKDVIDGLRSGKFIVGGIPIDLTPAALFSREERSLTHVFAFRLVNLDPPEFCLSFACFDDGPLTLIDYGLLYAEAHRFLVDGDGEAMVGAVSRAPLEGGFLLHNPDTSNEASKIEVISVYPPNMNPESYRWALLSALTQGIDEGFGSGIEE